MKIYFIIVVIMFSIENLFGQIDTTALSFYPLQKGNYWEYSESLYEYPIIYDQSYFSLKVSGDTLLPNGKSYQIIVKKSIPDTSITAFIYERIDTGTANVYRYALNFGFRDNEYLIDSLKSQAGDTAKSSRNDPFHFDDAMTVCLEAAEDTVLGTSTSTKIFANISYIPGFEYKLASGIGLFEYIDIGEVQSKCIKLLYARINEQEYGKPITVSVERKSSFPSSFKLYQNYPNPFNSSTEIFFNLDKPAHVRITVYNILGEHVQNLVIRKYAPGTYRVKWRGTNSTNEKASSGMYFYRMIAESEVITKRMILLR